MKIQYTKKGWKEITTKNIIVTNIIDIPFMPVEKWLDFNVRNPAIAENRKDCKRCKRKWEETGSENVFIVTTNDGNKTICEECYKEIKENIKLSSI